MLFASSNPLKFGSQATDKNGMSKSCCTIPSLCPTCEDRMWRHHLADEDYAVMLEIIAAEEQSLEEALIVEDSIEEGVFV
jgi:hypothetical protein